MTTTSDVGSISTWVLHINDNKPSKEETSEAEDNIFNDNEMENCASAGTSPNKLVIAMTILGTYLIQDHLLRQHTMCPQKVTYSSMCGIIFYTVNDAHVWYKNYAKSVGFSVRKDELRHDGKKMDGENRQVREPRGISRNGCKAEFRVNYDKLKWKYVVIKFIIEHTHPLVEMYETQFLRSHRVVNDVDLAHAKALRQVGVKVCQFMNYKSDQVGGFYHVGYMGKDMQNRIYACHRAQIIDTDTEDVITYLSARADYDIGMYFEYTLDEKNRLHNLFWTDIVARYDYERFGDVLAFNATYKKNAYNKPLVAFVGVNHHKRTTVLGFTILIDETVESYVWLLHTFFVCNETKKAHECHNRR